MAPLHTPIPTLQSQLHISYDALILTFLFAMILLLRGVRTQHTDMWRGTTWTTQLLYGHEARLLSVTRMKPGVFKKLLNWLQEHGDFKDTKLLSAAEKLVIFLMILLVKIIHQ